MVCDVQDCLEVRYAVPGFNLLDLVSTTLSQVSVKQKEAQTYAATQT